MSIIFLLHLFKLLHYFIRFPFHCVSGGVIWGRKRSQTQLHHYFTVLRLPSHLFIGQSTLNIFFALLTISSYHHTYSNIFCLFCLLYSHFLSLLSLNDFSVFFILSFLPLLFIRFLSYSLFIITALSILLFCWCQMLVHFRFFVSLITVIVPSFLFYFVLHSFLY